MPLTILAIGAAGPFAGLVVPELAKRGVRVRGLVRDPDQEETVKRNGASEVVVGDLADPESMEAALQGVDRAFYIGPAFMKNGAEIGRRFVSMAKSAGVRRVVFSGVIHPTLGALSNHADTAPIEEAILESGLEFAFLHPALFFQNLNSAWPKVVEGGVYAEPWSAENRFSRVDYRDVAEVAAIALAEDRLNFGTYELCSDGRLNRHDLVALMGETLGRNVEAGTIDPANIPNLEEPMQRMFAWYDERGLLGNALTLRAILGREPRSLRAYLQELAAGK